MKTTKNIFSSELDPPAHLWTLPETETVKQHVTHCNIASVSQAFTCSDLIQKRPTPNMIVTLTVRHKPSLQIHTKSHLRTQKYTAPLQSETTTWSKQQC